MATAKKPTAAAPAKRPARPAAKASAKAANKTDTEPSVKPVKLVVKEVTAARWTDFERLFESRGGPKYCWCMAWRRSANETLDSNADRKRAMKRRVDEHTPIGLLGYLAGEPVAWCSVAPRASHARLVKGDEPHDGIWSITCFYIARAHRRAGCTRQMVAAAVRHARKHKAQVVEAYPVDADSPSYRFMGFVPLFEQAGFTEIGREGSRRHVMRLNLRKRAAGT